MAKEPRREAPRGEPLIGGGRVRERSFGQTSPDLDGYFGRRANFT
jgi:hypothetical protein